MSTPSYSTFISELSSPDIKSAKPTPYPFVSKLYRMVNDVKTDDDIYWDPSGEKVTIKDRDSFSNHVLPNYYKHNQWANFVRQLNVYGFCTKRCIPHDRRHTTPPSKDSFTYTTFHPHFKKDSSEELIHITKHIPTPSASKRQLLSSPTTLTHSEGDNMKNNIDSESDEMYTIEQLQETVKALQSKFDGLNKELEHRKGIIAQNHHMIYDLERMFSLFELNPDTFFQETINKPTRIKDLIEQEEDEYPSKRPRLDTTSKILHRPNATKPSIYS